MSLGLPSLEELTDTSYEATPNNGTGTNQVAFDFDKMIANREPPKMGAFEAGLNKAAAGYAQAASQLTGAIGYEYGAKFWDEIAEEKYKEYQKYHPTVSSYKDIVTDSVPETLGNLMDYIGEGMAVSAPEIGLMLTRIGLAANAVQYFGDTINEQKEAGVEINPARALITAGGESLLNIPLTKGMKDMIKILDGTNATKEAKQQVAAKLIGNLAVDGGVGGAQQILRNYGVQGEFSTENVDEAIVGGLLTTSPIRLAEAVVNKKFVDGLADDASDVAQTQGVEAADGVLKRGMDFMVNTAMSPIKRFGNTEAGAAMFTAIENMRTERDLLAADWNNTINDIFKNVKDVESFRDAYVRGDRSTPELQALAGAMDNMWSRGNSELGANLGIGYIKNYIPTFFDKDSFTVEQQGNLARDYTNWFNQQDPAIRDTLVAPDVAAKMIKGYAQGLDAGKGSVNLPRLTIDADGNLIGSAKVEVRGAIKSGQLEHSRLLGFIPQDILDQYAVKEGFQQALLSYGQGAAQRITYAEQMGKNNEKLNGYVAAMGGAVKGTDLKMTQRELDTVYNAMDAYQGVYRQFQGEAERKFSTAIKTMTNFIALPLTTLSSLTEPFNVAIKVGNVNAMKAFAGALGSVSRDIISVATRGLVDKSETNKMLLAAGRSFQDATTALNNRINGEFLGKRAQMINNAFFHATGQTTMNYFVNSMAAHALQGQLKNDMATLATPPGSRRYNMAAERMAALGITPAMARVMRKDPAMVRQMMPSLVSRFNRDVALNPEALDKPLWMSTGWGSIFSQLKGYPTMYANTVLPKLAKLVDPRGKTAAENATNLAQFATTTGLIIGLGFLQESMKNEVRGGDLSDEEILQRALANTLFPIHADAMYEAATGGLSRIVVPVSFSVADQQINTLYKAARGEAGIEDIPVLKSFAGLYE